MDQEQSLNQIEEPQSLEDNAQSWITTETVGEDDNTAHTMYEYFMRPEPRENLGPIYEIEDSWFPAGTKARDLKVGMTRNAKPENRKDVTAYLEPYPHTRIEKGKPLQGWYKALHEPKNVRPRPCFTEAILTEPYGGWCAVGCAFCLVGGSRVSTPNGDMDIESLKVGDIVYGRTKEGLVLTEVKALSKRAVTSTIDFSLSSGDNLRCTPEHKIWSETRRRWIDAEDVQENEQLQALSETCQEQILQYQMFEQLQRSEKDGSPGTETLSRLRKTNSETSNRMRQMRFEDKGGERQEEQRRKRLPEGSTQIGRNEEKDERARSVYLGRNESKSFGTKISCLEESSVRTGSKRNFRLQNFEEENLYLSEGEEDLDEVGVGETHRRVSRPTGTGLGIRTFNDSATERGLLPSGFSVEGRNFHRGKRLPVFERRGENKKGEKSRTQDPTLQPGRVRSSGDIVVEKIERIQEEVQVYDIQTTSQNFYAEGVLVHNCYINSGIRGYRGTGLITVPIDYGGQIREQLKKMRRAAAVYFSSFTDPFLPLESIYHNTEEAARECVEVGLPIFFLSRLRYPDWAIELMKASPESYAQKSLNTSNPEDWRKLSPGALPLERHLDDIRRLKKAGIYVSIQVNPIIPGVTSNYDIVMLFKKLSEVGADHVIVKFVEAGYSWAPAMVTRMKKRFGSRGDKFERLFTDNIGGQRTIQEEYRLKAHDMLSAAAKKYGLTYATCYEYRYERDEAGNITSKTGVSIGREFTTADQCHGQKTSVYTRESSSEPFRAVEECPPSGCLHCASENEESPGEPRCGDSIAGEGKALRMVELKVPVGRET